MPDEQDVLRLRFFIGMTQKNIGIVKHMSRERVSLIEGKALRKMRHPKLIKLFYTAIQDY